MWAITLAVAALAGVLTLQHDRTALGISMAVLIASIVFLDAGRSDFLGNHGWIPWAWIALCLAPDFRLTFRSPLDTSVSSASLENFAQVIIYFLIAGLVLWSRRRLITRDPRHVRKGLLPIWPSIALGSTIWSLVPLFTFVRAFQLLVPVGLALLMVRLWLSSPELANTIWRNTLRLFVRTVTILVVLGFVTGFWREPRFAWPGIHPGVASVYMGVGLLLLIACGRSFLGFQLSGFVFRLLLFGAGLYLGETRAVIAALLVAIAVLLWWEGRRRPLAKYLGIPYYAIALALLLVVATPEIMQYLARGQTSEGFATLNGRIPLWWLSLDLLSDAGRWFTGFGYGAARVILPVHLEWAGTAHSSWVELLLAIGVLGPLLAASDILYLFAHASGRRSITPPSLTLSLLAFLVLVSITGEVLALPGLGFVLLSLLHAPVLAQRSALSSGARLTIDADRTAAPDSRATAPIVRRH